MIDDALAELTARGRGGEALTEHVFVGQDAAAALTSWLDERAKGRGDLVIVDPNTNAAAGGALAAALTSAGRSPSVLVLEPEDADAELGCDDSAIERVNAALRSAPDANPIAVGAGTINDIVKMACDGQRRYQSFATAASMNGYTSAIAAVLRKGVKRTLPARPAEAVFADIDVVSSAPPRLRQAGFGDLLSKPYSHADWLLSHVVRGVPFDDAPARLLDPAFSSLLDEASAIGAAQPDGIALLTKTLILSGYSMAIAGTSAPASGGEHLVSHYWDMERHCQGEPVIALHGTQVGIATRISALLFERLVSLGAAAIAPGRTRRSAPTLEELRATHRSLTPDVVAEVLEQYAAKQRHGDSLREELRAVAADWAQTRERVAALLVPASRILRALRDAGAADRPSAIGVGRAHAVRTITACRQIRSRYVALDLIGDCGLLDRWATEVVDEVEAA